MPPHPPRQTTIFRARNEELTIFTSLFSIWLIELARTLPPSSQLDGLDISFEQCPPKEWLPANISLVKHDVLSEPPPSLLETYDIIHVQLFITILRDGNPVPMLQNLKKMLSESSFSECSISTWQVILALLYTCVRVRSKNDLVERRRYVMNDDISEPGGYIQWAEWDVNTWEIIRVPSAPSQSNDELERLREWTSTLGKTKPGPSFISSGFVAPQHPFSTSTVSFPQTHIMIGKKQSC